MKTYELSFKDRSIPELSGYEFGLEIYTSQVGVENFSEPIIIIFPDYIDGFAISFVQGFISVLLNKVPKNEIRKFMIIKSNKEDLIEEFYDNATY